MHGTGIIAEKEMALREQRGKIGDDGFAGEVDRLAVHVGDDGVGDGLLGGRAEKNDVGIVVGEKTVGPFSEAFRGPTFGRSVGCAGTDGDAARVWA